MFEGMNKNVTSVGFYNDGRLMYSGGEDCMARIWDLRYRDNCKTFFTHRKSIHVITSV